MRFIICVVLLGVVTGYSHSSKTAYVSQQSIAENKATISAEEPLILRMRNTSTSSTSSAIPAESSSPSGTTVAESPSTSIPAISSTVTDEVSSSTNSLNTELPVIKPEPIEPQITTESIPLSTSDDNNKRRLITYDQRQEGQYNIRADLDNFMIVLIPPNPAEGLNLLDMLTKTNLRRNSLKTKRKHYGSTSLKYNQNLRNGNHNFNYLPRQHTPLTLVESVGVQRLPSEFIEGRTPYHVDISASDDEQSRLHPDRQVDVLPPPYPLAYQHLIKPFHLDAEPAVIQALPPAEITTSQQQATNNFLDSYNQLIASNSRDNIAESTVQNPGYYRMSRTIRSDNLLDNNRFITANNLINNAEDSSPNYYPPIDVPRFMLGKSKQQRATNDEERVPQELDEVLIVPASDELELDLHSAGVGFLDTEAKSLLADINGGMERCAPGRRRDSYGICREIEGY